MNEQQGAESPRTTPHGAESARPTPHGAQPARPTPHGAESARPRPLYGEYASAEEQRARIRQPDASIALDAGLAPAEVIAATPTKYGAGAPGATTASQPANARRTADRVITIGLLAYGVFTVVMTVISLLDFPALAEMSMRMMGIPGEFTNVAEGRLFGSIAAVALVVGWVITAWGAWRRLRAGRVSWWVPLVGAAGSYLVVYALLIPPLVGDPAIVQYVGSVS